MKTLTALLCALVAAGCNSGNDVPVNNMNVPEQCGAACGATQICRVRDVRFGTSCNGGPGPILCDAGLDSAGGCSGLCVLGGTCEAPPDGCSATDCECIIKKMCPDTNQLGDPCGGYCKVIDGHAQVDCLSCS